MALTYALDFKGQGNGVSATITSNTLPTVTTGDFITVVTSHPNNTAATAWTVSNTGTAITWTKRSETNTAGNDKVVMWSGTAGATPPTTVSVQVTAGDDLPKNKALFVAIHTGAHATDPLPSGNHFSGTGGTDVSQSITPTSSGSCLWMLASDFNATNSYSPAANCTLAATAYHLSGQQTTVIIRPSTQPRTTASAFTIGETDTSGLIAWVAFEVQSASPTITGTLQATNANDTGAASGITTVTGTLAKTNANDISSATGATTVTGSLVRTNHNDTLAATGTTTVTGTVSLTNNHDSAAAFGEVGARGALPLLPEFMGGSGLSNAGGKAVVPIRMDRRHPLKKEPIPAYKDEREDEHILLSVIKYCIERRLL